MRGAAILSLLIALIATSDTQAQERIEDQFAGKVPERLLKSPGGKLTWVRLIGSRRLRHSGFVAAAFGTDVNELLTGGGGGTIRRWRYPGGQEIATIQLEGAVGRLCFSADGTRALSLSMFGRTGQIWNLTTGKKIRDLEVSKKKSIDWDRSITSAALDGNGRLAILGEVQGRLQLWNLETGKMQSSWRAAVGDKQVVAAMSIHGRMIVSATETVMRVWDTARHRQREAWVGSTRGARALAISPDSKLVAAGTPQGIVELWDISKQESVARWETKTGQWSLTFTPDGKHIVAAGSGGRILRLPIAGGKVPEESGLGEVSAVALHPAGKRALIGLIGGLTLRDLRGDPITGAWKGHEKGQVTHILFSPDGKRALTAGSDQKLILWNADLGTPIRKIDAHETDDDSIMAMAISGDGRYALTGGFNKDVNLWDLEKGKQLRTLGSHGGRVTGVVFSPDRRTAVSTGDDNMIRVWDLRELQQSASFRTFDETREKPQITRSVAISPDGKLVLAGALDGTIKVWDLASQKLLGKLEGHTGRVWKMVITRDGLLCSIAGDDTLRIWDLKTRKAIDHIPVDDGVTDLAVHGATILVATNSATVNVYEVRLR